MLGAQESCESSAGTLDISLPGWAGPPLQKAAVHTYKQAVYTDQDNFHDNKERAFPWAVIQAQHQLTPPAQSWRWGGGCCLICSVPIPLVPHPKRLHLPLFPGTATETFVLSDTQRSLQLCKRDSKQPCRPACDFADER